MAFNGIGILPGSAFSYIDHLVPLCQIMEIPILVTDSMIQETIELFYPQMKVIYDDPVDFCLDESLKNYETFFYVDHFRMGNGTFQFAEYATTLKRRSVYSLHGNSEKGRDMFWIERLADEDLSLLYGPQMFDFLQEKGGDKRANILLSGNYRLNFYQKHKYFFDQKMDFIKKEKKILLYAPTWSSPNIMSERRFDYSAILEDYKYVLEEVPEDYQLLVKFHHSMRRHFPGVLEEIESNYPHVTFLTDFPLIYPLLEKIDIYLGDFSSVGYDFLYFKRPMFFLSGGKKRALHQCGICIENENIYEGIEKSLPKAEKLKVLQEKLYREAFGEVKPLNVLKKEIEEALNESYRYSYS